jgi:DNA helicase II / ATP-dependent DNA helicase PcrA
MTLASAGPRYTPGELARLLGLPSPTREQVEIISAPVAPLLVVAGAGSGKTETMAGRVVWLVANGYVRPEQVLGLTFTRKAAGELAHRVRARLAQLVRKLGRDDLLDGQVTVATYHSYAARILAEHGLRAGFEPTARLLSEASCWQLADSVVRAYDGDMSTVDFAPSTVTDAVLKLAADLSEHLVTADQLATWTGRFHAEVSPLPGYVYKDTSQALARQRARLALLPLVRRYTDGKAELEAIDFGDQMARAATAARDHPEVGVIERDRYRVVLLDEYQDTSHAQAVLLRSLFAGRFGGGHPVTAVGDPCQSIYGWRGASAGTLDRFRDEFRDREGRPAARRQLSTSWRNRPEILRVANTLSQPLRDFGHDVARLSAAPRVADRAGAATVHCALTPTYRDEAEWIADRILAAWQHVAGPDWQSAVDRPTTAVLIRVRAQIPAIEQALHARGIPVDVVGLGGLLDTPEVRDVVSTLRVLADPAEGAALLRLLTGPRWRIGPRDIVALYDRARQLAAGRRGPGAEIAESDRLADAALAEALDDLGEAAGYSTQGYQRFAAMRDELRWLRRGLDQPLPDLVAEVERTIGLGVEVATRPGDAGLARAHLDAFGEAAAQFSADDNRATLTAFLAFLSAAESEERGLPSGEVAVREGAVQILTVHAAKGLEWDVVAVAGLAGGIFPGPARASDHYLGGLGTLPFPLRGDRAGLPMLDLGRAGDQKDVHDALGAFATAWKEHDTREERRLAYVAVTRARRLLLCSGYWWGEGTKRPRGLSPFLTEIRSACLDGAGAVDAWVRPPVDGTDNPTADDLPRAIWPADPLGPRRPALEAAAALVRAALDAAPAASASGGSDDEDELDLRWAQEVDLLLAERARLAVDPQAPVPVAVPDHLSVSQLVTLRRDPQELARGLRRPLPSRPDRQARRGTAFHAWLEHRFGAEELLDLDDLPGATDETAALDESATDEAAAAIPQGDAALAALRERFLASEWGGRTPVQVEVAFASTVGGLVVRGRIDAVFADRDGGYEVVDWKTGRQPAPGREADAAAVQLAAYRLAWAQLAGVPVEKVRAAFHYVRDGVTVRPADLLGAAELAALVTNLPVTSLPVANVSEGEAGGA